MNISVIKNQMFAKFQKPSSDLGFYYKEVKQAIKV